MSGLKVYSVFFWSILSISLFSFQTNSQGLSCEEAILYYKTHGVDQPINTANALELSPELNPNQKERLYQELNSFLGRHTQSDVFTPYTNQTFEAAVDNYSGFQITNVFSQDLVLALSNYFEKLRLVAQTTLKSDEKLLSRFFIRPSSGLKISLGHVHAYRSVSFTHDVFGDNSWLYTPSNQLQPNQTSIITNQFHGTPVLNRGSQRLLLIAEFSIVPKNQKLYQGELIYPTGFDHHDIGPLENLGDWRPQQGLQTAVNPKTQQAHAILNKNAYKEYIEYLKKNLR